MNMISTARLVQERTTAFIRDCLVSATAQENLGQVELELRRTMGQMRNRDD
jgi:hypothetical protein